MSFTLPSLAVAAYLLILTPIASFAQTPKPFIQTNPSNSVIALAYSGDGNTLASGSWDRTIRLWDVNTRQQKRILPMGTHVTAVALSSDGNFLAGGDWSGTIKLWEVATGEELCAFKGEPGPISSLAFSPDNKTLAAATGHPFYDQGSPRIRLWNPTTGEIIRIIEAHSSSVLSVTFSPDGKMLASGSRDRTIKIWEVTTGRKIRTLNGHSDTVNSIEFSRDGKVLVSGSGLQVTNNDQTIKVWDVDSGVELRSLRGHAGGVLTVSLSPDGKLLASGSYDQTIKLWEVDTGNLVRTLPWQSGCYVRAVAISGNGANMATACGKLKIWEMSGGSHLPLRTLTSDHVLSVSYSRDRGKLICAGPASIKVWDTLTGETASTLPGGSYSALSHDGNRLISGSNGGEVKMWDMASGRSLPAPQYKSSDSTIIVTAVFSPDGSKTAGGGGDSYAGADGWAVRMWDSVTGRELSVLRGHSGPVKSVIFSPDGKTIASGSWDKTARLWDVASGKERLTLKGHLNSINAVGFSPNGQILASGGYDNEIKLWDTNTGLEIKSLKGHSEPVTSVAFSPDGKVLASGSFDKTVKFWTLPTGLLLRTLEGHSAEVNAIAFNPDGKILVSGSNDATAKLWDVASGRELASLLSVGLSEDWQDRGNSTRPSAKKGSGWLVVTPDGLFDGDSDAIQQVNWRLDSSQEVVPLKALFNDFYHPGLLAEIMDGGRPAAILDIAYFFQLPGLRAMLSQDLARVEKRGGRHVLCCSTRPTARPQYTEDALPLITDVSEWEFHKDDATCPWRKELPHVLRGETLDAFKGKKEMPPKLAYDSVKSDVAQSTLHVLTVGISSYDVNTSGFNPLPSSASGTREIEKLFRALNSKSDRVFKYIRVWDGLYNASATLDGIRERLSDMAKSVKREDVVFLYLSGHGIIPEGQEMFYFAPVDMRHLSTQEQGANGLNTAMLADAIRNIPAQRIVLIIDACQSGGAVESLLKIGRVKAGAEERRARAENKRGVSTGTSRIGLYIIAASTPLQEAVQGRENSALGATLLEVLTNKKRGSGKLWMSDVVRYIRKRLPQVSKEAGSAHTPVIISIGLDFPLFN